MIGGAHLRYLILVASAIISFRLVNEIVPEAYLDEVFHIPQTQQYCAGNWSAWDDKITTPPGLYALGVGYSKFMALVRGNGYYCVNRTLRHVNLVGVVAALPVVVYLMRRVGSFDTAVALANYPLIAFFGLLYYTDIWSTVLILGSLTIGSRGNAANHVLSAALAGLSITFRQTNIVWAAFVATYLLCQNTPPSLFPQIGAVVKRTIFTPSVTVPFAALAGAFAAFVKYNGGVALGDKSNHQINVNIPQLFYCSFFWALFSWPLWFGPRFVRRYIVSNFSSIFRIIGFCASCGLIAIVINQLTIVHRFMLADNRHYTFYLWRRLIDPHYHEYAKFLMVPVYHVSMWSLVTQLYSNTTPLVATAFIISTALSIVPSPLMESRYYILPFVFWRCLAPPRVPQPRLWLEWAYFTCINAITIYMFLYKPFTWEHEPDQTQRFMW